MEGKQTRGRGSGRGRRARAKLRGWASSRPVGWRLAVPVICALAGLLATTSMINARGTDLRGGRYTDLIGLVSGQRSEVQQLRRQVRSDQAAVDALLRSVKGATKSPATPPAGCGSVHRQG